MLSDGAAESGGNGEPTRAWHAGMLVDRCAEIVAAVRDESAQDVLASIGRALAVPAPSDVDPVVALVTVLAAAVPADARLSELLAWTRPLCPVPNRPVPDTTSHDVDVAVLMERPVADQVLKSARCEVVEAMTGRHGLDAAEIAARTGMSKRSVVRLRAETRAGEPAWRAS